MAAITIYYGSSTGNTKYVAELIGRELSDLVRSVRSIAAATPDELNSAEALILGVSTWEQGELQADWKRFLPSMERVDLTGKTVALFGLGNAAGFSGEFATALGTLHANVKQCGARIVGSWPTDGYAFRQSGALQDGRFVGLVIDEDMEPEKTAQRVRQWVAMIRPAFDV